MQRSLSSPFTLTFSWTPLCQPETRDRPDTTPQLPPPDDTVILFKSPRLGIWNGRSCPTLASDLPCDLEHLPPSVFVPICPLGTGCLHRGPACYCECVCGEVPIHVTTSSSDSTLSLGVAVYWTPSFPLAPLVAPLPSGLLSHTRPRPSWGGVQRHCLIKILEITWFLNRFMALEEERFWAELSVGNGWLKRSWWANFQPPQTAAQGL